MYDKLADVISKVDKSGFGVRIKAGDRIAVLLNEHGYAALASNSVVRFTPDEYHMYIPEDVFDRLLNADMM